MSIEATNTVWRRSKARGAARLVILCLANYTNKSGVAWPSIKTIADDTFVSERQVTRAIAELEESGEIEIIEKGDGRGRSTVYKITLKGDKVSSFDQPIKGDISSIKGDMVSEKGDTLSIKGDTMSPNPIEPLYNQEEEEKDGGDVGKIERHFTQTTGIMPTRSNWQSDWKMPIELWLKADDVATIKDKIAQAWAVAISKGFRVSSPRSLNNTMVNLRADRTNGKQNGFVQTWQSLQGLMSSYGADNKPELAPEVEGLVRKMGGWSTLCRMDLFEAQNKMRSLYNG